MQQQDRGSGGGGGGDQEMKQNHDRRGLKPPPVLQGTNSTGGQINQQLQPQKCPRCDSLNTKFCYYNNYSLSQPRYFCKTCRRYWTQGGTLRNVPVGGGCRKAKRVKTTTTTSTSAGLSSSSSISSVLMSTLPALRTPIISSVGTYNPVGVVSGGGGGGFLNSLAAIHQQSLSNQPSQLSFVNQAMTNFGVNLGSSNLGQVLLHGFPSQQQQRQDQFFNLGIRDDNTQRDQHQHPFYDQESFIQSSTNLAANSQNWHHQAAFFGNSSSTNPTDTTLWSTISTSIAAGHTTTTTTTTTSAAPTVYGGPSLNLDPWQHDHHLSGCGPPS